MKMRESRLLTDTQIFSLALVLKLLEQFVSRCEVRTGAQLIGSQGASI